MQKGEALKAGERNRLQNIYYIHIPFLNSGLINLEI